MVTSPQKKAFDAVYYYGTVSGGRDGVYKKNLLLPLENRLDFSDIKINHFLLSLYMPV